MIPANETPSFLKSVNTKHIYGHMCVGCEHHCGLASGKSVLLSKVRVLGLVPWHKNQFVRGLQFGRTPFNAQNNKHICCSGIESVTLTARTSFDTKKTRQKPPEQLA